MGHLSKGKLLTQFKKKICLIETFKLKNIQKTLVIRTLKIDRT